MHLVRRLTFVGWAAISAALAAGCAAISGLDKLEKVDCTSDCEAGVDASNDVTIDARADMNAGDDAPGDTTIGEAGDGGATDSPADAPADSPNDAPADSPNDAPNDAPADSPADAPPDGGSDCGATNTIQNCGACGNVCNNTNNTNRACSGTACLYTCIGGRSDCNSSIGANTDGCECATPGCCGTGCQTTHDNGTGQNFYDCIARDTYTQTEATSACAAYANDNAGNCAPATCLGLDGGATGSVVCSSGLTSKDCVCWMFDGGNAGHIANPPDAGTTCYCPAGVGWPAWH